MDILQNKVKNYVGKIIWNKIEIPQYIRDSLNPLKPLRHYQVECLRTIRAYFELYDEKEFNPNLLFHMATGSGKTLIMAGIILYLYQKGYRNFLFFVHLDNIISKTKENFLNKNSSKYLFAPSIRIDQKNVEINVVKNFEESREDSINICFSSIQKLHSDFTTPKENSLTFESFTDKGVVLISDEAHYLNGETKNGKKLTEDEIVDIHTWEGIINKIFKTPNRENRGNVLLEFTATEDLNNKYIADKYENKILFDYPLKAFRQDKYSKEISVVQTDSDVEVMALQAMILSQYKKHLFANIGVNAKPVVLFKSKTKKDNKYIHNKLLLSLESLDPTKILSIQFSATRHVKAAINYFATIDSSFASLISELKQDFNEAHSLLVDTDNKLSDEQKKLLNTLEEQNNGKRAIYAVDMLNEGWDVLNLFDIVRLYDTRDGNYTKDGYVVGKTTMQEAQLIGRGARYYPFTDNVATNPIDRRKYDADITNPLRAIETVHYHSRRNPDYIRELKTALVKTGALDSECQIIEVKLKDDFKKSSLYLNGYVFYNELIKEPSFKDIASIANLNSHLKVRIGTGKMDQSEIMAEDEDLSVGMSSSYFTIKLKELGNNVVRTALNKFETFKFEKLKAYFPNLKSITEFITSEDFLGNIKVDVVSDILQLNQSQRLNVAMKAIKQIEPILLKDGITQRGSCEFKAHTVKSVFKDHMLKISIEENSDKQIGKSMQASKDIEFNMDIANTSWHAYQDCFGSSEEKYLVKYIESIYAKLTEKYENIYLIRNECDLKLYSFDNGDVFEPDYVLFMKQKKGNGRFDSIQFFIEPKGEHLRKKDKWKEDFLLSLKKRAKLSFSTNTNDYVIWGLPFYTESQKGVFINAIEDII